MKPVAKILFLSAAIFAAVPVFDFGAMAEDATATAIKPPSVTVTTVEKKQLSERLSINGTVTPVEEVSVGADVAGLIVTELAADVGDVVKAGQVLARLDTASLKTQLAQIVAQEAQSAAAVAQAEAQILDAEIGVKQAKDQWERADSLAKSGVASTATRDNATNAYDSAKAKLNTAQQGPGSGKSASWACRSAEEPDRSADRQGRSQGAGGRFDFGPQCPTGRGCFRRCRSAVPHRQGRRLRSGRQRFGNRIVEAVAGHEGGADSFPVYPTTSTARSAGSIRKSMQLRGLARYGFGSSQIRACVRAHLRKSKSSRPSVKHCRLQVLR